MIVDADTATRDSLRTRRAVLEGAARALTAQGSAVTIATIAREAGVSKGGLLHHYPNKEVLLRALAEDFIQQFRDQVDQAVDLSENVPGKLLRGYVRAICDHAAASVSASDELNPWGVLGLIPSVRELIDSDARRWRAEFGHDGLHLDRILVVSRAADGITLAARDEESLTVGEVNHMRKLLLRMTYDNGPLG